MYNVPTISIWTCLDTKINLPTFFILKQLMFVLLLTQPMCFFLSSGSAWEIGCLCFSLHSGFYCIWLCVATCSQWKCCACNCIRIQCKLFPFFCTCTFCLCYCCCCCCSFYGLCIGMIQFITWRSTVQNVFAVI